LREQVDLLSEILERELKVSITGAELSTVFGRKGSWAHGMIAEHLHALDSPDPLHPGLPGLVDHTLKDNVMRFCLRRQQERQPVTFSDVIDSLGEKSIVVDRFWVYRFVGQHGQMLSVQRAKYFEKDRHDVSADDIRVYFESISAQLTPIPSAFFWNADETRLGSAKHMSSRDVIVASWTKPGAVTIPKIQNDAQLTLLTAISALGNSRYPYFISKNKTFEKTALEAQRLFHGHDYTITTSLKTFLTETLFIGWIEMVFLVQINYLL
jgi:hypothetical protein